MNDPCKVVQRIADTPLKPKQQGKGYLLREVLDITGIAVRVKSLGMPGEPPSHAYVAWIDTPNIGKGYNRLIKEGYTVTAKIKLIKNRYEVLGFKVTEPEKESTLTEQKAESKGLCDNY